MENKFFMENINNDIAKGNENNFKFIPMTNDVMVNEFINKNISLENIIERELFKNNF